MERQLNISESSNVQSAGYDPETQKITVLFKSGHSGFYSGCSKEVASAFEAADSAGKFVATTLKSQFPYTKIG